MHWLHLVPIKLGLFLVLLMTVLQLVAGMRNSFSVLLRLLGFSGVWLIYVAAVVVLGQAQVACGLVFGSLVARERLLF